MIDPLVLEIKELVTYILLQTGLDSRIRKQNNTRRVGIEEEIGLHDLKVKDLNMYILLQSGLDRRIRK